MMIIEEAWDEYWDSLPQKERIDAIPKQIGFIAGRESMKKELGQSISKGIKNFTKARKKDCEVCKCQET